MDNSGRQVIMGPPAPVAPISTQPNSGNPTNTPPQVTKVAAPPKRIIKKVQLDFNKLKKAGLDRQLAEVLRKQKLDGKKPETPTPTFSSSSAAAQSTSTPAERKLQQPQQQFRQPAPQTLVKRYMISEYIEKTVPIQPPHNLAVNHPTDVDRSKQVKTLLKNRILNKSMTMGSQAQQMPTTSKAALHTPPSSAQGTAPRVAGTSSTPAAFSVPIAKADLTVRPKNPPLLLNLVNQLPKYRTVCGSSNKPVTNQKEIAEQHSSGISKQKVSQSPQRIPVQPQQQISIQALSHNPLQPPPEVLITQTAPAVSIGSNKSPSPPLIVLENKVLAPNEKIDLSGLRLPNAPVTTTVPQVEPLKNPIQVNPQSKVIKGKVIMNANKLKVSREKLAEMAKEIRSQAEQVKPPLTPEPISTKLITPTIDTPFTMQSLLQRKKTPLFASTTFEENNDPVYNQIFKDLPASSSLNQIKSKSGNIPVYESPTFKPMELPVAETREPIVHTTKVGELSSGIILSTSETKQMTAAISKPSGAPPLPEITPKPNEYYKEVNIESSPIKPTEIEKVNTVSSPATTEPNAYFKDKVIESNTSKYIPLENSNLNKEIAAENNDVGLPQINEMPRDVITDQSVIDLPVCIPANSEKETAEPSNPDLPTTCSSKRIEFSKNSKVATPPVRKIETAVDFIAQLTAEHSLDESSYMELSLEEQRLCALFGGGGTSFVDPTPAKKPPQPEDELPIGKIVKMDDMNILHATLDVNSDSTNVLRISPNASMMQSSITNLDRSLINVQDVTENSIVQVNLPEPQVLIASEANPVAETPIEVSKENLTNSEESTILVTEEQNKLEKSEVPLDEIKAVSDAESKKEDKPPVKRAPIRSKKAKINLVQRTKRPSIPKPVEAKKTKLEFEEDVEETLASDPTFLEDRYGAAEIEVPADEEQRSEESTESREEAASEVTSPVEVEEDATQVPTGEGKAEETKVNTQEEHQRDLTQLYQTPKMPKNKPSKKAITQEVLEDAHPSKSGSPVSLIDVLSQDLPPPQGEAQLPFRKQTIELNLSASTSDATGIQNLIGHLTAEKITPQAKKLSLTSKSEEPPKPRKKLVKTRPVLSKRSSKAVQKSPQEKPKHLEFLHPVSANAGGRIPTSSTSDDDSSIFLGFDNKEDTDSKIPERSNRVSQMKLNETDISDDATPDYDETEEEQPSVNESEVDTQISTTKHKVVGDFFSDSDSSNCEAPSPIDLGDNASINEEETAEEYPRKKETIWENLVNEKATECGNDKEVPKEDNDRSTTTAVESGPPTLDVDSSSSAEIHSISAAKNILGATQPKKSESVINEKGPSSESDVVETPEKPSPSKDTFTKIRSTRSSSRTPGSLADSELNINCSGNDNVPQCNIQNIDQPERIISTVVTSEKIIKDSQDSDLNNISVAEENKVTDFCREEEKITEELVTAAKSRGKRKSRYSAPKTKDTVDSQPDAVTDAEVSLDNIGNSKEEKEIEVTEENLMTAEHTDLVETQEELTEKPEAPAKSKGKRKSRCTTSKSKEADTKTEPTSKDTASKTQAKKSSKKRETRSSTPKENDPLIVKPAESKEVKDSEGLNEASTSVKTRGKRQSRCSTSKTAVITASVSDPNKVIDPVKTQDKNNSDKRLSEDPNEQNNKEKRKSRSKTLNISASPVAQSQEVLNSEPLEEQEKVGTSEETNSVKTETKPKSRRGRPRKTASELNAEKSLTETHCESAKVEKDTIEQDIPKKLRGKRQSRSTPKSNATAFEDTQISIEPEEPHQVESDTLLTRTKRKTSSRFSLAPPNTSNTAASTPENYEVSEPSTKKERNSSVNSAPTEISSPTISKHDEPKVPAKRGRKRKYPVDLENSELPNQDEPKIPAKRGRKRKNPVDMETEAAKKPNTNENSEVVSSCDYNLRLLLIKKREQLDTEEELTEDGKGEGPLQCGLCLVRCTAKNWKSHLGEHYGVGWVVGDPPKKITRPWVMASMKSYLESSTGKLTCRLCNHQLGSYLGMILHLEGCGNKERLTCDYCQRTYTKLSLPVHIRSCPKRPISEKEEEPAEEDVNETVFSNAGRAKRKSTIKAETKLKKIGEELTSQKTSIKNDFDGDSSDYDMAKDKESSEEYDSEGVDSNEDALSTENEETLADSSSINNQKKSRQGRNIDKKRAVHLGECQQKPLLSRYQYLEARATRKWNEFTQQNYSVGPLFSQLMPSYSKTSLQEANDLLPSKDTTSMRYAYGEVSKEGNWKQLAPLEGFSEHGEYVGYLGKPIKRLEWVPLPPKVADQYLLCSLRSKMKTFARHTILKDEDSLLMLLKFTASSVNPKDKSALRPELHYGIRVPHGPVHSFCFLPSGGYDESSNRLGVLAVANASSDVQIYALPLNLKNDESAGANVVLQLDSLITLSLDVNNPVRDQCTKICWSQASGHNFLATGYSTGNIAFWDIDYSDNLNCFKRDKQTYFAPVNTFYIGERNIQFMDLHYDNNGPRWLAVGTLINQFKVYDIANWSKPFILTEEPIHTLYLASFTWSPICEALVVSSANYTRSIAVSPAGIKFEHKTLDGTLTTTRDMHTNCQQNHMVFVTDDGELVFLDVRDLNCGPDLHKRVLNYRAVSTTELHHLGGSDPKPTEALDADEFLRDYGVQINPLVTDQPKKKKKNLNPKRRPPYVKNLALTRFNCVRCNWNSPAHSWVAMGAEHGLLRILNFNRDKFF
ncbi:uncharacterized protein LOC108089557 isoform X2 [Drosophila ficusphila]|uniref:uncharacterized protein LOC108089557 isoform X2 n=1 Tax=Drosophila ficusphila TaxID=30025 RepID=UPI0007E6EA0B|nr:uncharacterized protein LOC108089557 isoform X2 [Drosophila ficusphila]